MAKALCTACEKNKQSILSVIKPLFENCETVLELGSGTGQHAVYFAKNLSHLIWYTSDRKENHADIQEWLDDAELTNSRSPLELNVTQAEWPKVDIDAVFSANTAHIMHWHEVEAMFVGVGGLLNIGGLFTLYGPFNYRNRYTSESNERFDAWLKQQDSNSAIRNFEDLDRLAGEIGFQINQDFEMPSNNRILCWTKIK